MSSTEILGFKFKKGRLIRFFHNLMESFMLLDSKREDSLRSKTSREAKEDEPQKQFHFSVYFTPFASHRHQIETEIQAQMQNKWQK